MKSKNYFGSFGTIVVALLFALPLFVYSCSDDDNDRIHTADLAGKWVIADFDGWYSINNSDREPIVMPDVALNYDITFKSLGSTFETDTTLLGPFPDRGTYWFSRGNHCFTLASEVVDGKADTTTYRIHRLTTRHFEISNSVDTLYTIGDNSYNYQSYIWISMDRAD